METNGVNTKLALINAAGELFSEHGYDGTSTRAIAEKAQVNIAGIKYHFGGKEGLYLEVINHVFDYGRQCELCAIIEKDRSRLESREGLAEIILEHVISRYNEMFLSEDPEWHMRLILQEVLNNATGIEHIVENYFRPKHQEVMDLYKSIKPNASKEEAYIWAFTTYSQIIFLLHLRKPIDVLMQGQCDYIKLLNQSIKMTATSMINAAGLPMPERILHNKIDIENFEVGK